MKRLKRADYMSEQTKQLEIDLKNKIKEDKAKAQAARIVDKIPAELRQYVLDILNLKLAAK